VKLAGGIGGGTVQNIIISKYFMYLNKGSFRMNPTTIWKNIGNYI
jgi:hypothetical protein